MAEDMLCMQGLPGSSLPFSQDEAPLPPKLGQPFFLTAKPNSYISVANMQVEEKNSYYKERTLSFKSLGKRVCEGAWKLSTKEKNNYETS